jgi:hypothetical protein
MKLNQLFYRKLLLGSALVALASGAWAQDHGHLYIDAYSTNAGSQLYFGNGNLFNPTSGFVKTLFFTNAGRFAGKYWGNVTTLTGRSHNEDAHPGDYGTNAAAPGSLLFFQIAHVQGPAGGAFEFWENGATTPTVTVPSGTGATNLIRVTDQGGGKPGDDPWGHIHGRRFTVTKPGVYHVSLRAWDLSTNGPARGPIHTPSDLLTIAVQGGANIASFTRTNGVPTLRFGTYASHWFLVQVSTNLVDTNNWSTISTNRGVDNFATVHDLAGTHRHAFYRLLVRTNAP